MLFVSSIRSSKSLSHVTRYFAPIAIARLIWGSSSGVSRIRKLPGNLQDHVSLVRQLADERFSNIGRQCLELSLELRTAKNVSEFCKHVRAHCKTKLGCLRKSQASKRWPLPADGSLEQDDAVEHRDLERWKSWFRPGALLPPHFVAGPRSESGRAPPRSFRSHRTRPTNRLEDLLELIHSLQCRCGLVFTNDFPFDELF